MISDTTLEYAEGLTAALLGVDAQCRSANGEFDEALVVLNMDPDREPESFHDWTEARRRFDELRDAAATLPEPDRRLYYRQLCSSTLALIQRQEGDLPFAAQISEFLHVPSVPVSEAELDTLRRDLRRLLTNLGYDGDLETQAARWEEHNRVPRDEIPSVLTELLDGAWERTAERIVLPAPKSDGMVVETVSGVAFNARCDYLRRRVELNVDPILTRPALKHLAVHECYPGHYVQFKLRETWYREGKAAADGLLSIVNSASSCTFEGIADNGMRVIDWLDTPDDVVSALLTRYRAGLGTVAAWRYHALGQSESEVRDWLRQHALIGGEGWVDNRLRFIAAPQRSALIWSYWHGEPAVASVWERIPISSRDDFLVYLYGRMHSCQTVGAFAPAS